MRMLYWPLPSPTRTSNRLPGNAARSLNDVAASIICGGVTKTLQPETVSRGPNTVSPFNSVCFRTRPLDTVLHSPSSQYPGPKCKHGGSDEIPSLGSLLALVLAPVESALSLAELPFVRRKGIRRPDCLGRRLLVAQHVKRFRHSLHHPLGKGSRRAAKRILRGFSLCGAAS